MSIRRPEEMHAVFSERYNAGDLDGLVALYEPNAKLVSQPGDEVQGREAVRAGLQGFLALMPRIDMTTRYVLAAGDTAVLSGQWKLTGTGPGGTAAEMTGKSVEVLRRQPDGTWLFVLDLPFGAD
jgi:uncharacterized protein (TIGR02246 family)